MNDVEVVQPTKEWVLPARGKPGRKPSTAVPPTKRKAQNRESQRAFRERRQAYVTELENKVAQFEAREIEANVQLQRLAWKCREEAEALQDQNVKLAARCEQLEHQVSVLQLQLQARTPRDRPSSPQREDSAAPDAAPMAQRSTAASPPDSAPSTQAPAWTAPAASSAAPVAPLPAPTLVDDDDDDGPQWDDASCGFCTDASVCVCRGEARLDMDSACDTPPTPSAPNAPNAPSAAPNAPSAAHAPPNAARLPALPAKPKARLWAWSLAEPARVAATRPSAMPYALRRPRALPTRPRLWSVTSVRTPSSPDAAASPPECTGDPRHCRACQSDSALQAFCGAVSRAAADRQHGTPSDGARESVPDAFSRLRTHPNFAEWRGGLDMLADVVARDSVATQQADEDRARKRARTQVMVRTDAVSQALAMLDTRGDQVACPCPWARTPARQPWPRSGTS